MLLAGSKQLQPERVMNPGHALHMCLKLIEGLRKFQVEAWRKTKQRNRFIGDKILCLKQRKG